MNTYTCIVYIICLHNFSATDNLRANFENFKKTLSTAGFEYSTIPIRLVYDREIDFKFNFSAIELDHLWKSYL